MYRTRVLSLESSDRRSMFLSILVLASLLFAFSGMGYAQEDVKESRKVITSRSGATVTIAKSEVTTRPDGDGRIRGVSRRVTPSASGDPAPTVLKLFFPTLVYPGEEVAGKVVFNDPDDYVFAIFITVFFPDGDVVTDYLYDYRIDGGDVYKGTYKFWIDIPNSETPLPGRIVITCSDEFLNVSEITQSFVAFY